MPLFPLGTIPRAVCPDPTTLPQLAPLEGRGLHLICVTMAASLGYGGNTQVGRTMVDIGLMARQLESPLPIPLP